MLDLVTTTQFRKDLKRIRKRGYDLSKLDDVLQTLYFIPTHSQNLLKIMIA